MKKAKKAVFAKPNKMDDIPVTKRLLDLTKQELKGEMSTLQLDTKALRLEMKAGFAKVDTKFEALQTQLTRMLVMMEEQNDRNRVVMDGYTIVYEKLQEHDCRFDSIERHILG